MHKKSVDPLILDNLSYPALPKDSYISRNIDQEHHEVPSDSIESAASTAEGAREVPGKIARHAAAKHSPRLSCTPLPHALSFIAASKQAWHFQGNGI